MILVSFDCYEIQLSNYIKTIRIDFVEILKNIKKKKHAGGAPKGN